MKSTRWNNNAAGVNGFPPPENRFGYLIQALCSGFASAMPRGSPLLLAVFVLTLLRPEPARGQGAIPSVSVDWAKVLHISKTAATLQVVVSPLMRRGSPVHDRLFQNLRQLACDDVRYDPWLPYPRFAVAELEPPRNGKTSWDFSLLDPITEDVIAAAGGHSLVWNFSVIPSGCSSPKSRYPTRRVQTR